MKKFKFWKKMFYLKKRKDKNIISEKELSEYNNIISHLNVDENELSEFISKYGYSKVSQTYFFVFCVIKSLDANTDVDKKENRYVLLLIVIFIIVIFFSSDKNKNK